MSYNCIEYLTIDIREKHFKDTREKHFKGTREKHFKDTREKHFKDTREIVLSSIEHTLSYDSKRKKSNQ